MKLKLVIRKRRWGGLKVRSEKIKRDNASNNNMEDHSHYHPHSHSHTRTHIFTQANSHMFSQALIHTLSLSHTHFHTNTHIHTLTRKSACDGRKDAIFYVSRVTMCGVGYFTSFTLLTKSYDGLTLDGSQKTVFFYLSSILTFEEFRTEVKVVEKK